VLDEDVTMPHPPARNPPVRNPPADRSCGAAHKLGDSTRQPRAGRRGAPRALTASPVNGPRLSQRRPRASLSRRPSLLTLVVVPSVWGVRLRSAGESERSLTGSVDTTTPGGRLVFHVFDALAEFERELIRERTRAGLDAARARGRHGGRPTVMTAGKLAVARQMYASREHTMDAIAKTIGVARATVYRHLAP
jgi:Resolvase, N terminal domain